MDHMEFGLLVAVILCITYVRYPKKHASYDQKTLHGISVRKAATDTVIIIIYSIVALSPSPLQDPSILGLSDHEKQHQVIIPDFFHHNPMPEFWSPPDTPKQGVPTGRPGHTYADTYLDHLHDFMAAHCDLLSPLECDSFFLFS